MAVDNGTNFSKVGVLNMKTLYCFKFDDITGDVTRIAIHEYKEMDLNKSHGYKFHSDEITVGETCYFVELNKLDRFCHKKVFTFHEDYQFARKIIENTLLETMKNAERKARRCSYLVNKLERSAANEHTN